MPSVRRVWPVARNVSLSPALPSPVREPYFAFMLPSEGNSFRPSPENRVFATTHWSVVVAAGDARQPGAREALEKLCHAYWYPLYLFIRRSGHDEETAKDLTQGFFEQFLAKKYLGQVDR